MVEAEAAPGGCCSHLQLITALNYSFGLNKQMLVCFCLFHFALDNSSPHRSTKVPGSVPAPGSCVEVAGSPRVGVGGGGLQVTLNSPGPSALLGDSQGALDGMTGLLEPSRCLVSRMR